LSKRRAVPRRSCSTCASRGRTSGAAGSSISSLAWAEPPSLRRCPFGEEVLPMQTLELIKLVRQRTGVGPMDARKALAECGNDVERAVRYALDNRKGPKDNDLAAGRIEAGTHNGRIAALVEVRGGTDFVARTDEFR